MLINFSRETMSDDGQGGGHFSPLAAYDEETDSFLVVDVARYKYPPFWVDADLLWQAMATTDAVSDRHRGYVIIDAPQAVRSSRDGTPSPRGDTLPCRSPPAEVCYPA